MDKYQDQKNFIRNSTRINIQLYFFLNIIYIFQRRVLIKFIKKKTENIVK